MIVWILVILFLVIFISSLILFKSFNSIYIELESLVLEVTWTIIPVLILITVAFPRVFLLCLQDAILLSPFLSLKIFRRQWNWQREYLDLQSDHLLDREKLDELVRFEYPFVLPINKIIRILLTSRDVLHSLGLPSLGIKLDSNPGRLNSTFIEANRLGLYLGSCYELCGRGHRAIPIFCLIV